MTLLSKIIDESIGSDSLLTNTLRKCLVLAHELKNERLKTWALGELYGFSDIALAPPYRKIPVTSVGSFVSYGAKMADQPLPSHAMKADWVREYARTVVINDSIASLQSLLETEHSSFALPWTADLVSWHHDAFFEDFTLLRAHRVVPRPRIVQICDTVRNKILEFALELKGEVGETGADLASIPREHVEQVVNQYFYGDNNVVGSVISGGNSQASKGGVVQGDFSSLGAALTALNVSPEDIETLNQTLQADAGSTADTDKIGPATQSWIGRIADGLVATGKAATSGASSAAVTALIRAFLGL